MLVDSHCHLNFPEFKEDLDTVIAAAKAQGVGAFLTVNTCLSEALVLQEIAERFPEVYCSVGIHPHEAQDHLKEGGASAIEAVVEALCAKAQHPKCVALGETGLDYYYNKSSRETQMASFEAHVIAAQKLSLPLIIHTRDADEDTLTVLRAGSGVTGVFHCFSGDKALAKHALDLGFYISFSGILTFKTAEALREIAKSVPEDRLLVETDAPFLAPVPYRGKRNEPAFVRETARVLAEARGVPFSSICDTTSQNFYALFRKCLTFAAGFSRETGAS